jgi:hypothetical protein
MFYAIFSSYLSVLHTQLNIKVLTIVTDTLRTGSIIKNNMNFDSFVKRRDAGKENFTC